jgi:dephospho-CoA kinase
MLRVALTGGIATGKTYVRARFDLLGIPTIDADAVARAVVLPGSPGLARVVERFGPKVLRADGHLHREVLAAVVFADPEDRRALEAIVHPEVRRVIREWETALLARGPGERPDYCVADIPLLFETGRGREYDVVVVTACAPEEQVRRVMARDGATEAQARARLAAQLPIDEKARLGNYVIRTDGTFAATDAQVADVHARLVERSRADQ